MSDISTILVIGCNSSGNGGIDISHLVSYTVQYPKLWSSDSGRNLRGDNKATLVGIFTKLVVTPNYLFYDNDAIESILEIINSASVYCKYYDPATQNMRTESFYFGDIETTLLNAKNGRTGIGQFSIIANKRRSR